MIILKNLNIAACSENWAGEMYPHCLVLDNDLIHWIGEESKLPAKLISSIQQEIDFKGRLATPGLIDCHSHIIYGANRAAEFAQRLQGVSYEAIANKGGGIISTVTATRSATKEELFNSAASRLCHWIDSGFTSIEIKSGYGLNLPTELKMLKVARLLGEKYPIDVYPTLLAAHTLPKEYEKRPEAYIQWIIDDLLAIVIDENLAGAIDVFCDKIAFNLAQSSKLLTAAKNKGLQLKIHAEQLSNNEGASMAAKLGALSADHLEYLSEQGISAMQKTGTIAVLLPLAYYFLRESKLPPISGLRKSGVNIALGSDSNPGSAPVLSPLLTLNMGTTLFKLTAVEALLGMTINAAKALGIQNKTGSLEVGKAADIAIWDLEKVEELSYWIGHNPCHLRIKNGVIPTA